MKPKNVKGQTKTNSFNSRFMPSYDVTILAHAFCLGLAPLCEQSHVTERYHEVVLLSCNSYKFYTLWVSFVHSGYERCMLTLPRLHTHKHPIRWLHEQPPLLLKWQSISRDLQKFRGPDLRQAVFCPLSFLSINYHTEIKNSPVSSLVCLTKKQALDRFRLFKFGYPKWYLVA